MMECLESTVSDGNDKEAVFAAGLMCGCVFEHLALGSQMSEARLKGGVEACAAEVQADPEAFVWKYAERSKARADAAR